ncbi:hypothetical protein B296_00052943 [Ensete ventricosum]|uniref:Uncharacterized protein n=1 Tax=Ensete ventricosum TaxID=4639 RepID=A0A426X6M9_ENSVE|nr:hypothetical protein B296_00052943 [Ensete ventricosum]
MLPFPAAASLKVQRNRRHGASSLVINPPAIIYLDWDWDAFTQSHCIYRSLQLAVVLHPHRAPHRQQ